MALDAVGLENSGNLVGISDVPLRRASIHAADAAADRPGQRRAHIATCQDVAQCFVDISSLRFLVRISDTELIVNQPGITDDSRAIDYESFRRSRGPQPIGDLVSGVLADRKRNSMQLCEMRDRGQGILLIGIDAEKPNPLALILCSQLDQSGGVSCRERALRPQKDDDVRPALLPAGDCVGSETISQRGQLHALTNRAWRAIGTRGKKQADND